MFAANTQAPVVDPQAKKEDVITQETELEEMTRSAERVLVRGAARQILTRPSMPEPPADAKLRSQWYGRKNGARTALLKGSKAADDSCHYLSIALPLYRKGFVVWNISKKSDKAGATGWNSLAYEASENLHRFIAGKYPDANACVISHRGVGNPIVLDIDADGVIERIERETGYKLPATYTVCSRPRTKPFKRHYYFLQTEFSVNNLYVEVNGILRDLCKTEEKDGHLIHPNMLDVKGCGNGGFVVAAGSIRKPDAKCPEGDAYTCVNDSDIVPIPDWLVTWLVSTREAIEQAEHEAQERRDQVNANRTTEERKRLQEAGDESAFNLPYESIFGFLTSRAHTFAGCGIEPELREQCLLEQVRRECAGGVQYAIKHADRIHKIAYDPSLVLGTSKAFRKMKKKKKTWSVKPTGGLVIAAPTPIRQSVIVDTMNGFPTKIGKAEGWKRLIEACKRAGFTLKNDDAGCKAVQKARVTAGFKVNGIWWKRSTLGPPNIIL
jgi:hypothetical protein